MFHPLMIWYNLEKLDAVEQSLEKQFMRKEYCCKDLKLFYDKIKFINSDNYAYKTDHTLFDIKDGRTVKGTNFKNLRDAGDPVELGALYAKEGADELVFLDITATIEKRKTLSELVNKIAHHINIPFTVGGGISSVEDVNVLLQNGADKISVNTSAFKNPQLINELAKEFGSQCVVLAIDTKKEEDGEWYVYLNGGRTKTEKKCFDWAKEAVDRVQEKYYLPP